MPGHGAIVSFIAQAGLGLLSGSRALTLGDNRLGETNIFGILGFPPALVFAIVLMIAMFIVARWAFFSGGENT